MGLACYKVGLDRHLIRTVFVANLFRSAAVSSTTPLELLDGISCIDDVCFCKRLVFKALREVA